MRQLGGVSFVLAAAGGRHSAAGPERQRAPVVAYRRAAVPEDFNPLFGKARVPGGLIRNGRDASVLVAKREEDAVVGRVKRPALSDRLGVEAFGQARGERHAGVDRMAGLADDPPSADFRILRPVLRRQRARGKTVRQRQRVRAREKFSKLRDGGGKAAVEADHQDWALVPQLLDAVLNGGELARLDAEGLFHEDVLAGAQRGGDELSMQVVPGGDEDGVGVLVGPDLLRVGGSEGEVVLASAVLGAEPLRGTDAAEIDSWLIREERQQHHPSEIPRADEADSYLVAGAPRGSELEAPFSSGRRRRILQEDAQRWLTRRGDELVGVGRALDRKAVGGEPLDGKLSRRHQLERRLHVSLSGPARVSDRVVAAAVFILWISTARSQRKRDGELELL